MYHLVRDDDAHWYVIDVDDDQDFYAWVESTGDYKEHEYGGKWFDKYRIPGSPSSILFKDYEIK